MLAGKHLGGAIERARIAKGISKKQLADDFGVKPPSVQGWIHDGRIDKKRLLSALAKHLESKTMVSVGHKQ